MNRRDNYTSIQVNRARYMPQNPSVIATKTPTSEVIAPLKQQNNRSHFQSLRCWCLIRASRGSRNRTPTASASQSSDWEGTRRKGNDFYNMNGFLNNPNVNRWRSKSQWMNVGMVCPGTQIWTDTSSPQAMIRRSASGTSMELWKQTRCKKHLLL